MEAHDRNFEETLQAGKASVFETVLRQAGSQPDSTSNWQRPHQAKLRQNAN